MKIDYKVLHEYTEEQLESLFLSVNWESGNYPKKLVEAMKNSSFVISAWDKHQLVGLIRSLDDGVMTAFVHYLLVRPEYQSYHIGGTLLKQLLDHYQDYLYIKIMPSDQKVLPFYEKYGFKQYDNYSAMVISRIKK